MAKLRHVAMQVPDLEKASNFYEKVFGMKRLVHGETPYGNVQMMSDGLVTLALLNFPQGTIGGQGGPDWSGLHHIGFVVDDHDETAKKTEKNDQKKSVLPQIADADPREQPGVDFRKMDIKNGRKCSFSIKKRCARSPGARDLLVL